MRRLFVILLVLAVVLAVALAGLSYLDARARTYAEDEVATRLAANLPGAAEPSVQIEGFPFVGGVMLNGTVDRLTVRLDKLTSGGVTVREVVFAVDELELDRDLLLSEQKVRVIAIGTAKISGRIDGEALARFAPVPVKLADGMLTVTYRGKDYEGMVTVSKHALLVSVAGMPPMIVPLPEQKYIPCDPVISLSGDHIAVECTLDELPKAVADVLGAR